MENQHNNTDQTLAKYRAQIDEIDQKIIDLINQRMEIVIQVGKHKEETGQRFFIKSSREADMIKNLINKASDNIPKSAIVSIWRKIITSANILEQGLKIAVQNPEKMPYYDHIIKEYYADFIDVTDHTSSTKVISAIESNEVQLGIFSMNDNSKSDDLDHWWINIANNKNNLRVFAKIPFVEYEIDRNMSQDSLVVVGIKDPEQSKSDKTLLTIELEGEASLHSLQRALNDCGFNSAKIIKNVKVKLIQNITFYLVEIDGFFLQNDPKVKELATNKIKPHVKVIGHYPTPILL